MTVEEIKSSTTMTDVLSRYGITVRNRMCSCPFHGVDRHPSMQIFKDGYKCHTCGEHGDIFQFVQKMESCGFKDAFLLLGGHYERGSDKVRTLRNKKFERERNERKAKENADADFKRTLARTITILRTAEDVCEHDSDMYADAVHMLPYVLWIWEEKYINGNKVAELDVYRTCKRIEQRFLG